jgi:hypothetical protein
MNGAIYPESECSKHIIPGLSISPFFLGIGGVMSTGIWKNDMNDNDIIPHVSSPSGGADNKRGDQ